MKRLIKKYWLSIGIILLIFISNWFLLVKGLAWQHDIPFHYSRMLSLAETIKNGDILAFIHDTFYGYGYALGIFYNNFFFYIPALLCILGIPSMISYKILFFLINVATILITYFVSKQLIKDKKISFIITILYSLAEYRLYDVFVRGAIGEMLAFMIAPIIILGLYELIYGDYKKWYYFTIGFVLMLLSHLITTVLMALFCVIIILLNLKRLLNDKKRIYYLLLSGIVGLSLGAFCAFPILEQYLSSNIEIFVNGSHYVPSKSVVSLKALLIPDWFFKVYLGISIILLIPIRFLYKKKDIDNKYHNLISFSSILLVLGFICFISTTNIFPWVYLDNMLSFIQFPWRLLLYATLFLSISTSISLYILSLSSKKKIVKIISLYIILVSFIVCTLYSIQFGLRKNRYDDVITDPIGTGEYFIADTNVSMLTSNNQTITTNHEEIEFTYTKKGTTISITYDNNTYSDTYLELPLIYYLGYSNDANLKMEYGNNNLIRVYLNSESGSFTVSYTGTTIQKISYIYSFISLIGFTSYLIINKKRKK